MSAQVTTPTIETKTRKPAGRARGGLSLLQETLAEGVKLLAEEPQAFGQAFEVSATKGLPVFGIEQVDTLLVQKETCFLTAFDAPTLSSLFTFEEPLSSFGELVLPGEPSTAAAAMDTLDPIAAFPALMLSPLEEETTAVYALDGEPSRTNAIQAAPEETVEAANAPVEITEAELRSAAELLDLVASSPHPAKDVADRLEIIEDLIPALMEMNIRQANAEGRPDLAAALRALLDSAPLQQRAMEARRHSARLAAEPKRPPRVLFVAPGEDGALLQSLPAGALANSGVDVTLATRFPPDFQSRVDLVIARCPHENPELLKDLAACAAVDIPIILDLDVDVEQMPLEHPQYASLGLSNQLSARAYNAALLLAGRVRVPNEALAIPFRARGCKVHVIPNGWNRENHQWEKTAPERHGLQIGWIQNPGEFDDIAAIRRIILRVLREFPQARLVISGDPRAYQMFDSLPDSRRLYLPPVSLEDQPYLLRQIDILLIPLRNTPFNATQCDDRLMEAGLRGIPWVASPAPAFTEWGQGGLLAAAPDEWHSHLRQLMLDESSRATLGMAGRMKAEGREISRLAKRWLDLVQETLQ
jgi:glycosyltransferase involved in cell wall biosynthesis